MVTNARLRACACGVTLSLVGTCAQAGLVETHVSDSFGEITDWVHNFQIPQFDDMGGTRELLAVVVTLDASIEAESQAENLESWEHTITLSVDAFVSLEFLDEPLVAPTGVQNMQVFKAGAFDGAIDFEGVSGTIVDLSGSAKASTSRSGPDDLSPWIGDGTIDLVGKGTSVSTATGPGNVIFNFHTVASGQVTVRYEYIPTPGAWTILGVSLAMLVPRRRRIAA